MDPGPTSLRLWDFDKKVMPLGRHSLKSKPLGGACLGIEHFVLCPSDGDAAPRGHGDRGEQGLQGNSIVAQGQLCCIFFNIFPNDIQRLGITCKYQENVIK